MSLAEEIQSKLIELRKASGMPVLEVAVEMGCDAVDVMAMEMGDPEEITIKQIHNYSKAVTGRACEIALYSTHNFITRVK